MLDPVCLRSFLAVADIGGFSAAARELGLRQSTVSGHIARLESAVGRQLFSRDTHSVELTADGTAMLGFARKILRSHEEAEQYFTDSLASGRLRFGVSQDLVLTELPRVLQEFRRAHPRVDLELTVGFSDNLYTLLRTNQLDLVFGKRRHGQRHGTLVFSDVHVWAASPHTHIPPDQPVPFVTYPPPSITRDEGLRALEQANRSYRITCTAESIIGLRAAALAGLGVVLHAKSLLPEGLAVVPGLPRTGAVDYVLIGRPRPQSKPEKALARAIQRNVHQLHR